MKMTLKTTQLLMSAVAMIQAIAFAAEPQATATWTIETVDVTGAGRYSSLQVDPKGNVHVAYIPEIAGHPLHYAFWDRVVKKWFTMRVAAVASFCTLVLDSKQYPHISYADHGTGLGAKLRHAFWDGSTWKIVPLEVQPGAVVAYFTSMALDANDKPFFSFYDYADPTNTFRLRMRSVFWMGSFWQAITVDPGGGSGKFNSIAVDSKGQPHIAYANVKYETSGLRYADWDGKTWRTEVIDGIGGPLPVYSVAMVLDKSDNPHIVYTDVQGRILKYATRNGKGPWRIEAIDAVQGPAYPDRNGIALDKEGNPYLSYYDEKFGILKVAFRKSGKWFIQTVDRNFAGFTSSVGIDNEHNTLWVSYADDTEGTLKVAHRELELSLPSATAATSQLSVSNSEKK
jgi:hypothetical protein